VLIFDDAGRISATGDEELLNFYPDATLMDGNGRTVLPGLTDAHAHVLGLGLLKSNLDLLGSICGVETKRSLDTRPWLEPGDLADAGVSLRKAH